MTLAGGGHAAVWFEMGGTVTMHTSVRTDTSSGSGSSNWKRCTASQCLGEEVIQGACLAHASDEELVAYRESLQPGHGFSAKGVEMTPELWAKMRKLTTMASYPHIVVLPLFLIGAVFPFKIVLREATFRSHVSLTGAILEQGCEFTECTFEAGLSMDYMDSRNGPSFFQNCTIAQDLSASYAHTNQYIAFVSSEITGAVRTLGVTGDFRLDECTVTGPCDLKTSKLDHLSVASSVFEGNVDMTGVESTSIRAAGVRFSGSPAKIGPLTATSIDFAGAQFGGRVEIAARADRISFTGSSFPAGGRLELESGEVDLAGVTLGAPLAIVGDNQVAVTSIQNADAGSLTLSHLDLSNCLFHGAHGLESIGLEPSVRLRTPPPMRARRRCTADEFAWRVSSPGERAGVSGGAKTGRSPPQPIQAAAASEGSERPLPV